MRPLWQRALLRTSYGKKWWHWQAQLFLTPQQGLMSPGELKALHDLVLSHTSEGLIIEIGTLFGTSALIIALAKKAGQKLICVDNFTWNQFQLRHDEHAEITRRIIKRLGETVELVEKSDSEFFLSYCGGPPAIAFFDAMHDYASTSAFIRWAKSVGTEIICGHDYNPSDFPGVIQAVDEAGGPRHLVETFWVL